MEVIVNSNETKNEMQLYGNEIRIESAEHCHIAIECPKSR